MKNVFSRLWLGRKHLYGDVQWVWGMLESAASFESCPSVHSFLKDSYCWGTPLLPASAAASTLRERPGRCPCSVTASRTSEFS